MKHQLGQPSRATWLSHPLNLITWVPPARPLAPVLPLPSPTALGRSYWESTPSAHPGPLCSHTHPRQPLSVQDGTVTDAEGPEGERI